MVGRIGLGLACALLMTTRAGAGEEDSFAVAHLREDFARGYNLRWHVVRPDADYVSLTRHPGRLTITTQPGWIYGGSSNEAKNLYLIANPLGFGADFTMSLVVTQFQPSAAYHQVALLCYTDDDNYLKWGLEHQRDASAPLEFLMVQETQGEAQRYPVGYVEEANRLWLRLTKRRDSYTLHYSLDGKQFVTSRPYDWGDGGPPRLGFMAISAVARQGIEVCIDSFELRSPPDVQQTVADGRDE